MARILLGWELGANRGHLVRLLRYAAALRAAGHAVAFAAQRMDGFRTEGGGDLPVWQAPVWPRLLAWASTLSAEPAATMGDILARLGLADPDVLPALIGGWEAILAAERPDLVVAEYAPALLRTAEGRVPAIATGCGFDLPPADMPAFPSLTGEPPRHDEAALLEVANAGLRAAGRRPLAALPAIFAADRALSSGLDELDPYAGRRPGGAGAPLVERPLPPLAPPEGDELFVYWPERAPAVPNLWQALQACGLPVRLYVPGLSDAQAAGFAQGGFAVEQRPVAMAEIVRRSRLMLSHGGGGFVLSALMCGRPQVVVHYDMEKRGNGMAVDRLGTGAQMPLGDFDAAPFAAGLRRIHGGADWHARAMALAASVRARHAATAEDELLAAVAALL